MNPSDSRQPWDKVFGNVRQIRASSSGTLSPTWHGRSCEDAPTPRRMPYPVPCPGCSASGVPSRDRKSTRLNSSHGYISYAVFCLKKKKKSTTTSQYTNKIFNVYTLMIVFGTSYTHS